MMRLHRAALVVPASEPRKVAKAIALDVDDVVVDLEDAVVPAGKDAARHNIERLPVRERGSLSVRVNPAGSPWHEDDVAACAANPAVTSLVLPKASDPAAIRAVAQRLDVLEHQQGRAPGSVGLQALIETPAGVHRAVELPAASARVTALVIGYADLSASMGRRIEAPWHFARDTVLLAARLAGIRAIEGPVLTIGDDDAVATAASRAERLGFDGMWVIHPRQVDTVTAAFTPSHDDVAEARSIVDTLRAAADRGVGAVEWRGRMLDEAVATWAKRILDRAGEPETHE